MKEGRHNRLAPTLAQMRLAPLTIWTYSLQCRYINRRETPMSNADLLGVFEQLILMALVHLKDQAYGVTVRREVEERTGRSVSMGAVYATLDRLEKKGYVSSFQGEPTPERGGRAKRFFRIERPGSLALRQSLQTVKDMSRGLKWALP
jgi:DNA-binding PadR family transcriptional regulator